MTAVIPTRNRLDLLGQALESALTQEGVSVEAIVVDEGSSDGTREWLEGIEDSRLVTIHHPHPRGVAAARNAALARARGRWIAFLDDDDLWAPSKAVEQLELAERERAGLVIGAMVGIDEAGAVTKLIPAPDAAVLRRRLLETNPIGSPSCVIVRADVLEATGGFDERLSALADWDLWLRIVAETTASTSRRVQAAYRDHPASMMVVDADRVSDEFELLVGKHGEAAAREGLRFGARWSLRWSATRDLAAGRRGSAARAYLRRARLEGRWRTALSGLAIAGGPAVERLARFADARRAPRPAWLDRYSVDGR